MVELGELEIFEGVIPEGCSCRGVSVFLLDDSSTNQRTEFRQKGRYRVDLTAGETRTFRFKVSNIKYHSILISLSSYKNQ